MPKSRMYYLQLQTHKMAMNYIENPILFCGFLLSQYIAAYFSNREKWHRFDWKVATKTFKPNRIGSQFREIGNHLLDAST